jgi:maltooligosyltrehalose trehalohydrolase
VLNETRDLLAIRQREILPLTRSRFIGADYDAPENGTLRVAWRFEAGTLRFMANFSDSAARLVLEGGARPIWTGSGAAVAEGEVTLPPWTGAFLKDLAP